MKLAIRSLDGEPGRLAALNSYRILDTPKERDYDDIADLAAKICDTPIAVVNLIADGRQFFKAEVGLGVRETPLDSSFCAKAILEEDFLVVPDATKDPRFECNPLVTGAPNLRFYAGALLKTEDGHAIGTVCVLDYKARDLTRLQERTLRVLARQVMRQLELRRAIVEREEALTTAWSQEAGRQESEQQYRALFQALDDGFCTFEMKFEGAEAVDYRFIDVNAAFERLTGITDARGKWMRTMRPEHERHWYELYGTVAQTGTPVRFVHPARALEDRWFEVHAFRVGRPEWNRVGAIFSDVTARRVAEDRRAEAERSQALLNGELSHRMKNTFAMVHAIAAQTLRRVPDREPVDAFIQRIHALSAAHDVLLRQNWASAQIKDIVDAVLTALAGANRVDVSGPQITLGPRASLSLSLLLHELSTNATKYGALSFESGRVAVTWRLSTESGATELALSWIESGGPAAEQPTKRGFGSRLIGLGLVGTGGVDLRYLPSGFRGEFRAPLVDMQQF